MKPMKLILTDADGKRYHWMPFKDKGYWFIRDHNGYERALDENWSNSVPMIKLIAENHGFTCPALS